MKSLQRFVAVVVVACALAVQSAFPKSSGGHSSSGSVHVKGYTKKDGTYVAPHERSAPNHTKADNWSTKGNVNPYTGKKGAKDADDTPKSSGNTSSEVIGGEGRRANWTPPTSGRSKQEILEQYGEPNLKTTKRWVYSGKGEIQLTDKGLTQ